MGNKTNQGPKTNWITTFTGRVVSPLALEPCDVCIEDIAHALSLRCRYGGQCKRFYSVAEHCCRVAWALPYPSKLYGLLHDAFEAYTADICGPIKNQFDVRVDGSFMGFCRHEQESMKIIWDGLGWPHPIEEIQKGVDHLDAAMLHAEMIQLMAKPPLPYEIKHKVAPASLHQGGELGWSPLAAEAEFLSVYNVCLALRMGVSLER